MLYPKAYRDIDDIYSYIALEKLSPEKAKGQTDRIWEALKSLEECPESHQERLVGGMQEKNIVRLLLIIILLFLKLIEMQKQCMY